MMPVLEVRVEGSLASWLDPIAQRLFPVLLASASPNSGEAER